MVVKKKVWRTYLLWDRILGKDSRSANENE
jgi:hypothetical protein